uniref:Telomerase reverse transcriptase n=1 Tax=Neogobius melanostomus TaxID=47308 RepID=A0A8C6WH62_9GOBI
NLKRKRKKNVLIHGYSFQPQNEQQRNADQLKFQGDVTQSAAYIHGSDLWKKVTKRLGTDITRYLLENCSMFVAVPPSCLFQLCGIPVYDRISMTSSVTGLALQSKNISRMATRTKWPLQRRKDLGKVGTKIKFGDRPRKRKRKEKDGESVKRLQGMDLIRVIFFEGIGYLNGVLRKPKKLPKRFLNMMPVFNQLLRRHRGFSYGRILQKLCPSRQQDYSEEQEELSFLLSHHCTAHRVYLFVRDCLIAVIPQDLWGSDQNRTYFLARVRCFLSTGKFERLSLADLMWKMKVDDCDWIKISKTGCVPQSELAYRTKILGQFLAWLLDGYVVGLVRPCFYVTESVGQKNALRFYRQEVWAKLGHLSKGQMEKLTPSQVASIPKSTVDVSGAYESLPHDKLLEVVTQALRPFLDELFTLRRFAKVWSDSHEVPNFLYCNFVLVNSILFQHFSSDLHGKDALQFFTQMLTGSVVQFGKKGIPQGSVVSSLLCCLCYGHMENMLFKNLNKSKGHLLRFVDDFLLITPDLHEAQTFLKTLLSGVPQYGLTVNPQKVVVNFKMSDTVAVCPEIRVLPPRCMFPWCGLLLDTHSLDPCVIVEDYAGMSLRYSLTLGSFNSAGVQMKRKLMAILRLKCHALFLDLKVVTNSIQAVYQNIYKLVLLHACR